MAEGSSRLHRSARRSAVRWLSATVLAVSFVIAGGAAPPQAVAARDIDVVPDPSNTDVAGAIDLASALSGSGPARPGDVVWVHGGTYRGCFKSTVKGSSQAPVVVRAIPGDRVTLDGAGCEWKAALTITGPDVWFWGLEITNSDPSRVSSEAGSQPASFKRGPGLTVQAARTKLINLVVHDNGNGIGFWDLAVDSEIYGTITANNGWRGPDRGHGHGIYIQNSQGIKRITDVVSLDNFSTGMKGFGYQGRAVGLRFDGIMSANNGAPAATSASDPVRESNLFVGTSEAPADDIAITNSALYSAAGTVSGGLRLGWTAAANGAATVKNNYIATGAQGMSVDSWSALDVQGNTIYASSSAVPGANSQLASLVSTGQTTWNNNTYYDTTPVQNNTRFPFAYNNAKNAYGGGRLQFSEWRDAARVDSASTYRTSRPTGQVVMVRPNQYEPGRANVAIFNWDQAPSVALDLSAAGLRPGNRFELRDPLDFYGRPVLTGTWTGTPISVPLANVNTTPPLGHSTVSDSTFSALIVLSDGAVAPPAPPPKVPPRTEGSATTAVPPSVATDPSTPEVDASDAPPPVTPTSGGNDQAAGIAPGRTGSDTDGRQPLAMVAIALIAVNVLLGRRLLLVGRSNR